MFIVKQDFKDSFKIKKKWGLVLTFENIEKCSRDKTKNKNIPRRTTIGSNIDSQMQLE